MEKNFLFLGFAIPDKEMKKSFEKDEFPAIQTHKFNWNVVKGIEYWNKFKYTYISARPVSEYPYYKGKKIKGNKWSENILGKSIEIREIPYINSSILKIITRFISGLYYSFKEYHNKNNKGGVIVYSVHVPFMLIGYIIAKVYKIDYIAIWTDPPALKSKSDSFLKGKFRNFESFFSKFLMKKASKVIALTKYLAQDFAPSKPYLVIEGIINEEEINKNIKIKENSDIIKIVYTGSLCKTYGIGNIVEAFILIKEENVILEIYGKGNYEDALKCICRENKNIRYKGFISNEEVLKIQREADFLINARSPQDEYVKYSFPSKTLEYMLSGTPVISTMLPGIPEEYEKYILILKDNNIETIYKKLTEIIKMEQKENERLAIDALEFARSKNYINQGKKIIDMISEV